jgi:tetratricopeptide (TPR) repeat protein
LEAYQNAVQLDPSLVRGHYRIGWIYNDQKNYDDAVASLKRALKLTPNDAVIHNEIAYSLDNLGRTTEAIEEYQEAIRLDPQMGLAYIGLGDVYKEKTKQIPEAIKSYVQGIKFRPNSTTAMYNLGWCYNDVERYNDAVQVLLEAVRIDSDYPAAHNELGYSYNQLRRYPEAIQEYQTAIRQSSDYALAYYNLGLTYKALGNRNLAMEQYRVLQRLDKDRQMRLKDRRIETLG